MWTQVRRLLAITAFRRLAFAVSYTHLDVYKRQGIKGGGLRNVGAPGIRLVQHGAMGAQGDRTRRLAHRGIQQAAGMAARLAHIDMGIGLDVYKRQSQRGSDGHPGIRR